MFSDSGFKERLRDELAAGGGGVSSGLAADALTHGRRLRRRQRHLRILSGTGAVAAVAVGAVVLSARIGPGGQTAPGAGPGHGHGTTGSAAAGTPGTAPSGTSTPGGPASSTPPASGSSSYPSSYPSTPPGGFPTPTHFPAFSLPSLPAPVSSTPPANGVPGTAKGYAALLQELLPGGQTVFGGGSMVVGTEVVPRVQVEWTINGGTVEAEMTLSHQNGTASNAPLCEGIAPSGRTVTCARQTLADGSQVRVMHEESGSPGALSTSTKQTTVTLDRADGVQLVFTIGNGTHFGPGPRLARVPLTDQQAYAIAADPRWGFVMDPAFVQHAEQTVTQHQ